MEPNSPGLNITALKHFLPQGYIGERLFRVLNFNSSNYINLNQLISGLSRIYFGEFEDKLRFVFEMYDCDKNGLISQEDIRLMLSYVPMQTIEQLGHCKEGIYTCGGGGHDSYYDRVQIQMQMYQLFTIVMANQAFLTLDDFKKLVVTSFSDMFICLFLLIRQKLPGMSILSKSNESYKTDLIQKDDFIISTNPILNKLTPSHSIHIGSPFCSSIPITTNSKPNPFLQRFIDNNESLKNEGVTKSKQSEPIKKGEEDIVPDDTETTAIKIPEMSTNPSTLISSKNKDKKTPSLDASRMCNVSIINKNLEAHLKLQNKIDLHLSPTLFLDKNKGNHIADICKCGKMCEFGSTLCVNCKKIKELVGNMYIMEDSEKLTMHWFRLIDNNLFCKHFIRL